MWPQGVRPGDCGFQVNGWPSLPVGPPADQGWRLQRGGADRSTAVVDPQTNNQFAAVSMTHMSYQSCQ